MTHEFEVRESIEIDATPEQVWEAISTGPGIDSWFMGRNEIEGREGGRTRMTMGGLAHLGTVTAYEPGRRFGYASDQNPDGTFMAFEYLIEGREGGSTVLRLVHNGFLGDDWEAEYDALSVGDRMYLRKLAAYLEHFPGRTSTYNLFAPGSRVTGPARAWAAFKDAFGLRGEISPGDPVRVSIEGLPPSEGVLEWADHGFMGARTGAGLYMLLLGHLGHVVVEYHDYTDDVDGERLETAWQAWLEATFA
ncbi:SRPBCC family protein [Actinomadura rugatobispora]|uniref:SRPBCC domain-containing protein n=1 Tax=Actinomadura rugatobispora TaxID=1994 RepID=A0ABW0ZRW6_9ACTN|nr:SRPBCC domain-containing protein [Actinomadura rugatobispora]